MSKFGENISKLGDYIGNNKKPLLYVGGAIAITAIGVAIVKRVKRNLTGADVIEGNYVVQDVDFNKTSITPQTAKNYAESLYRAFTYYWGTDKGVVNSVFDKINSEDYKLIHNQYGVRSRGMIDGKEPTGFEKWLGFYKNLNLTDWINAELDLVGDKALKEKIRKIAEPAGFIIEK